MLLNIASIRLDNCEASLIADGIILIEIDENAELEREDIVKMVDANLVLADGKPYAVVIISGEGSTISKEGREEVASGNKGERVALALVVTSLAHKIIGNFFIRVNKPVVPTRLFTQKEEAVAWASGFLPNI